MNPEKPSDGETGGRPDQAPAAGAVRRSGPAAWWRRIPPALQHARSRWADALDPAWWGPFLAIDLALWQTRKAWGSRLPAGQDTMALLVRTQHGLGHLLAHGHLDGWLPNFAQGYQEFLFYGPGQTFAAAISKIVTLGFLSDAGSYKVVAIVSLAVFPLSVAWLARSLGLTPAAAGVAALLSLLVDNQFGVGLRAIFENSLIAQQLAASLVFVVLGGVCRLLTEPRRRCAVFTGVALAALIVTHIISTVMLAILLVLTVPTILFSDRPKPAALRELAVAGFVAAGLGAFWFVPLLAHHNLRGAVATWGTPPLPDRLGEIWRGTFLVRPHIAELVAVGWGYGLYRVTRNRRWSVAVLLLPMGYVLACRFLLHRYPHNDFAIQIENRGIGMAAVIATFPLAELLVTVTRRLGPARNLVRLGAAAWLVTITLGPLASVAQQMPPGTASVRAAAIELNYLVPPGSRWVEVRDYPREETTTGLVHPDFWLAEESQRWTANEFNPESSTPIDPTFVSEHLLDRSPDQAATALARLGVTYVVATSAASASQLEASALLPMVWRRGGITILRVVPPVGQPDPSSLLATESPATAALLAASPEHFSITVTSATPTMASIAVAWSPKWHARVDGRSVPLLRTADGLCGVALPAGQHQLTLSFLLDKWDRLGYLVSGLSLIVLVFALVTTLRAAGGLGALSRTLRRQPDSPGPPQQYNVVVEP